MGKQNIVILSGAGISAESGLSTFRGSGGLWEGRNVMDVASPEAFAREPQMVLDFYNMRRRQLHEVEPNEAHLLIAKLEEHANVHVVTQNVDDLHERAGSSQVLHLHGELFKARSTVDASKVYEWTNDLNLGDQNQEGEQLRPHIVWFGEEVPLIPKAAEICSKADIMIIIGTSLQVYPAAGLSQYAPPNCMIYLVDPEPPNFLSAQLEIIPKTAVEGMKFLFNKLNQQN